jgi:anti-sigma factor RsiW
MLNPACWLVRRRLDAYRDGELDAAVAARTDDHLAGCGECAAELASLGRLHSALALDFAEPPEAVWDAFWPQVRARVAASEPEPRNRRAWPSLGAHPRLALGSVLAAAALVVLTVFGPWSTVTVPEPPKVLPPPAPVASGPAPGIVAGVVPAAMPVVVQSVETAAPDSAAMVFTHPDTDSTVVWVFGLEKTDI